jgi:O-antigen/teichoic acid export membrane protein
VIFFAALTGMSFCLLVEVRLMVLRRWGWVFGRALLVAAVRLPFLSIHPLQNKALWLFLLVAGPQALSGLIGAAVVQTRSWTALFPLPAHVGRALRYASVNYLGQLAIQAPFFLLPVVVLLSVRPSTNAVFYVAWSVMAVVFISIQMISQALLAEGGKGEARLDKQVQVTLLIALSLASVTALIAYLGSGSITWIYGAAYASVGGILPTLALAMIPWAFTATFLAEARVREDALSTVAISVGFAAFTLVPAVLLSTHNELHGVANAWLFGNVAAGCLALALSKTQRNLRHADRNVPSPKSVPRSVSVP